MKKADSHITVNLVSSLALILEDSIVVLVTWRKTYRNMKAAGVFNNLDLGLSTVIFRDGEPINADPFDDF